VSNRAYGFDSHLGHGKSFLIRVTFFIALCKPVAGVAKKTKEINCEATLLGFEP